MAMRLSGLMSGMDTETIIEQLVQAKRTKVDTAKKAQTKLSWKQDAWKELNTKLKSLQSKHVGIMRFQSSYSKKTTKVSNTSAVSVITGDGATNGVQSLRIEQLAKTGYLTGGKIEAAEEGTSLSALSKISDIKGFQAGGTIDLNVGGKTTSIEITEETTISDVLSKMKEAGVNASFDAKNSRFFVSAKESGESKDFSLTAGNTAGSNLLGLLGLDTSLTKTSAEYKEYSRLAGYIGATDEETIANMKSLIQSRVDEEVPGYLEQYKTSLANRDAAQKVIDEITDQYQDSPLLSVSEYETKLTEANERIAELEEKDELTDEETQELETLKSDVEKYTTEKMDAEELAKSKEDYNAAQLEMNRIAGADGYIEVQENTDEDGNVTYEATATAKLSDEIGQEFLEKAKYAKSMVEKADAGQVTGSATKITGQDAVIYLNGAKFTNNDNVFEINGLTFTALAETGENEVMVTTQDDVDGIYDMIKSFLKDYNALVNEMDKLYNADSARGYEPLTDDEKEAMSDGEIEKYESKIKDALLRRDSNLSTVNSTLKQVMAAGVEVNGKTLYLSNFGINTLGYFEAADNEKNAYHIDGDADDESTAGNADKLKSMISSDPDTVIQFFSRLSKNFYAKMDEMSKSVDGYRSYGNFYDDKKMKSDYEDYKSKISDLEDKLNDYEDKWYSKFSAMETALAKMQSNASAVTSLLGGGS